MPPTGQNLKNLYITGRNLQLPLLDIPIMLLYSTCLLDMRKEVLYDLGDK